MSQSFDKALKALQSGQTLTSKDGILTPLIKQLTEAALDFHLAQNVEAKKFWACICQNVRVLTSDCRY